MNAATKRDGVIVHVQFDMKTTNPNNGAMGHSRLASILKSKERKAQRETARAHVLAAGPLPELPVIVRVTRMAPSSGLDPHDGLGAALKGVIDGVADALGLKSDRDPRVSWQLDQCRTSKGWYAVKVCIIARPS